MPRNILAPCESTMIGLIVSIEDDPEKGYSKLVIANAVPWKTQFRRFYVWRKQKLFYGDSPYKKGDLVYVEYKPAKFDRLMSLELLDPTKYADCPTCFALAEVPVRDAESTDCGHCSIFDSKKRARAPKELTLIASSTRQCEYSAGQCLTFVDDYDTLYFCWVFSGKPYYADVQKLDVKRDYRIKGWLTKQSEEGHFNLELSYVPTLLSPD